MHKKKPTLLIVYNPWKEFTGSLLEMLINSIKTAGFLVEYLNILNVNSYVYSSKLDKIKNVFQRNVMHNKNYILYLENRYYNNCYLEILKEHKYSNQKYDYILVIKPEEYSPKFIKELSNKGDKIVGYIWDGLREFLKPNLIQSKKYYNHLYSFDSNDINKHTILGLEFCTNFLVEYKEKQPYANREIDLFYVGDLAGKLESQRRDIKLNRFLEKINGNFDISIWLGNNSTINNVFNTKIKYIDEIIPMDLALRKTAKSKVIIDICKSHHIGLSFRFFECLATETKIITNNKDVVNYDFYNNQNIMIVDFDKDQLSQELFNEFINTPYQSISKDIIYKYSIENWLNYMFKHNKSIDINKI